MHTCFFSAHENLGLHTVDQLIYAVRAALKCQSFSPTAAKHASLFFLFFTILTILIATILVLFFFPSQCAAYSSCLLQKFGEVKSRIEKVKI